MAKPLCSWWGGSPQPVSASGNTPPPPRASWLQLLLIWILSDPSPKACRPHSIKPAVTSRLDVTDVSQPLRLRSRSSDCAAHPPERAAFLEFPLKACVSGAASTVRFCCWFCCGFFCMFCCGFCSGFCSVLLRVLLQVLFCSGFCSVLLLVLLRVLFCCGFWCRFFCGFCSVLFRVQLHCARTPLTGCEADCVFVLVLRCLPWPLSRNAPLLQCTEGHLLDSSGGGTGANHS